MRFYVLLLTTLVNSVLADECSENKWLAQKDPIAELNLNLGPINKLQVSEFWFTSNECIRMPTEDFYVIQYNTNGYPAIIDRETGHGPKLQTVDLDSDGIEEVVLAFKSGGNQTLMNIYRLSDFNLSKLDTTKLSSNMASIEIVENSNSPVFIKVSNAEVAPSNQQIVVVENYFLSNGKLKIIQK
ncbi:hypothetical protein [Shewanella cyperi]|uniref:hypothetical protein n=1 Tax=Shewanella cyperi TaxID=2814292 RepID=UPI001A93EF97|nr:hypothetical protein [Shewanella cyperi]QSX39439.1 hypothetical protein JYB84_10290 [Shewanella cyperi]